MIQQSHQTQVDNNEMVKESFFGLGRFLVTVLRVCFRVIGKIVSSVAYGFYVFVDSAEKHGRPGG